MTDDLQPTTNRIAVMVNRNGFSQSKENLANRLRFIFMRLSVARIEARLLRTNRPKRPVFLCLSAKLRQEFHRNCCSLLALECVAYP